MINLILYSTVGCHLCEQAIDVIQIALQGQVCALDEIDIADDDALMEQYGIRIPVVKNPQNNKEVGWPFGPEDISLLLVN